MSVVICFRPHALYFLHIMRKIILVSLLAVALGCDGQNNTLTAYDTVKYGNCGDLLLPMVTVNNTSSNPITMLARRILKNIPAGWTSCFCYPYCVPQDQDSLYFTIVAGGDKNNPSFQFVAPNFGTDSFPGIGEIMVVVGEVGVNHTDTIRYRGITACLTGIHADQKKPFLAMPNPSADFVIVKHNESELLRAKLVDMNGREMIITISTLPDEFKLDLSALSPGQYILEIQMANGLVFRERISKL